MKPEPDKSRFAAPFLGAVLVIASLAVGYALVEAGLMVVAGFASKAQGGAVRYEDLYVSSRPIAVFDHVMGYRRVPGPMRIVRIIHDELVFDHTFTPNNMGYISKRDYSYRKPSPDTARLIVFGDSFTAEEFNETTWVDRVQDALHSAGAPYSSVELYSFAVNGAGLGNWHSIFFNDVVPHYDFDGVVIADFGDDLARSFSILHYEGDSAYSARFPTQPADDADFRANYLPRMPHHPVEVASNADIDRMIASLHGPWRWPGLKLRAPGVLKNWWQLYTTQHKALARLAASESLADGPDITPMDEIERAYDPQQMSFLKEIVAYCHDHNIPVILASVPGRDGAQNVARARGRAEAQQEREVKSLAAHLGTMHFDGYHPFAAVRPEDVDRIYWLKYDPHWAQAGSDLFAAAFTDYLRDHIHQFLHDDAGQPH